MRNFLLCTVYIAILFLLFGCATARKSSSLSTPSFAPVSNSAKNVRDRAKALDEKGAQPKSQATRELKAESEKLLKEIDKLEEKVVFQTDRANDSIDEKNLAIDERDKWKSKYDKSNAAIWKRNWIIVGTGACLLGSLMWIFKGPLGALVGFFARKGVGVPW